MGICVRLAGGVWNADSGRWPGLGGLAGGENARFVSSGIGVDDECRCACIIHESVIDIPLGVLYSVDVVDSQEGNDTKLDGPLGGILHSPGVFAVDDLDRGAPNLLMQLTHRPSPLSDCQL